MGSADFLKSVRARFVSAAELVVSVACSDDKHPLSIQDAARVILACSRPTLGQVTLMRLEETGLPGPDPDGRAIQALERLAGFDEELTLGLPRNNPAYLSIRKECLKYGFNDTIWTHLAAAGIGTHRRVDPTTGDATHTLLSSLRSSTLREIGVFLEPLDYRPNTHKKLRMGYRALEKPAIESPARQPYPEIDQKIDLWDAVRWLEHQGVKWPIPKLSPPQCIASESEQIPGITGPDKDTSNADHRRIEAFASKMAEEPEQSSTEEVEDLRQQLGQECATSEIADRSTLPPQRNKAALQEQAVLDTMRELGYKPEALPPRQPGKKWVKAETREALTGNSLFEGQTTFGKAWDRLRAANKIVEQQ